MSHNLFAHEEDDENYYGFRKDPKQEAAEKYQQQVKTAKAAFELYTWPAIVKKMQAGKALGYYDAYDVRIYGTYKQLQEVEGYKKNFSAAKNSSLSNTVKPGLEISQPGDASEVQADAVADAVVSGGDAAALMEASTTTSTVSPQTQPGSPQTTTPEFDAQLQASKGSGQQLDESTRSNMEAQMGTDLSGVKIHTDSNAQEMADAVNAKAFTHGQDVYFGSGFSPGDTGLLAHELAHVGLGGEGIMRFVDPTTKPTYLSYSIPKKGIIYQDTATLFDDNAVTSKTKTILHLGDTVLVLGEVDEWLYVYDSTIKTRGYVLKSLLLSYDQELDTALLEQDIEKLQKLSAYEIAKVRGIAWADIKKLFLLDKDYTDTKAGSHTFIKQKLLEGWHPEDGTPQIRTWYEDGMLVVDAWTPTLARIKVLEMGYKPDTGLIYRWNRSYYSDELNKSAEVRKESTFSFRNIKNQLELDFEKASSGLTPFEGDIYQFSKQYGSFAKFIEARFSEKMGTFKEFNATGIAWDPPSEHFPQGGVYLRSSPFGEGETDQVGDNELKLLPFNTSFKILRYSEIHDWYYVQLENSEEKGYVASHLVKIPPEPTAKLHLITKNQSALEVVALYYAGTDARNYVNMLAELNGTGIVHPRTGKKEDWNETRLLKDFLIWIPGRLFASKYVFKQKDNYGSKYDQLTDFSKENQIFTERQGLSHTEIKDWTLLRDKVFRLDKSLIERFNNLTGISWGDFLSTLSGVAGLTYTLVTKNLEAYNLDKDLKKQGSSLNELFQVLVYFKKISLKKLFDLLDQSATIIQLEKQKYRSTDTQGFGKLMEAITAMRSGYDAADKIRAKGVKKFFQTEDTTERPDWRVYVDRSTMEDADVGFFMQIKAAANDETELLKILSRRSPEEVPAVLARYLLSYSNHSGKVSDYMNSTYPEFKQAAEKESEVDKKRITAGQIDSPVLADSDPDTDWREISRLESREAIRKRVIEILNRKAVNVKESRVRIAEDTERIWELGPVLQLVLNEQNIVEGSNIKLLVWDRVEDHERHNTMRSICLAALGIILGLLGFFTGGATWAVWASVAGSVIVSGIDLYFELKDYYFIKGATDTGIGSIIAISDKHPSLIGIVFALLGLIIDAATLVKHGLKIAGIIGKLADETADSTKILSDLYDELRLNKMIAETLSKDDFIKQMDELLKRDKALLEKHREAIEGLMKQMKIAQKLDNVPAAVQYALARMYDVNPTVTRAIIKAKDGHKIFLRLTVDLLSSPNAVHDYTKLANLFLKEGEELSEEGVTVLRYLSESIPGTIDECSSVVKVIEEAVIKTGKNFDPKFMQEVLTDQRLRKLILENPADLDAIAKHYDEWVKNGSKGAFADDVAKNIDSIKNAIKRTLLKEGETILGRPIKRVRSGDPDKIVIIGMDMDGHVIPIARELESQGYKVEILEDGFLNGRTFEIDGKKWTVTEAWEDMVTNKSYARMRGSDNKILPEFLDQIPMYKLNQRWITEHQISGKTIIDVGAPPKSNRSSLFYDMEVNSINWNK